MKVCIYGTGAIGGHVAVRLLAAKAAEVSVVARGEQLQAIRRQGLTLRRGGQDTIAIPAAATDDPAGLPGQDLVIVTLKAYALAGEAERIAGLLKPDGAALFIVNGIPWWWNHGLPSRSGALELLDPGGKLWRHVTPQRVLGCVVYSSNTVVAPGVVKHDGGNQWTLGEPDGRDTPRLGAVVGLFNKAGLRTQASSDLRRDIWEKLVLNAAFNPICALTRLSTAGITDDRALTALAGNIVDETLATAAALGCDLRRTINASGIVASGGNWRPSMLQDVDRGRPVEVEAILGQVQDFAHGAKVATPAIDTVVALLRGLDRALRGA
jgi:2-dehydropantoate 2-reductase